MAYYTKGQISEYIKEILERAKNKEIRIMSSPEEAASRLGDEQDLIPMFWIEIPPSKEDGTFNMKMDGKVFVKIEFDLYSDDRYAIDCYQACKEGTSVSEIVRKRNEEAEELKKTIPDSEKNEISGKILNELKEANNKK